MNNHELIISGRHLELTESLKEFVREKTERLFRHEERIVRIRIELEVDKVKETVFRAKGIIEITGPDMVASEGSDEMHKSIDLLVNKLDRMIRRRARLKKVKRNHPHSIDIPASLPKVASA